VIVAPLVRRAAASQTRRITPLVQIDGETLVLSLPEMSAVESRRLRRPVAELDDLHDMIRPAIDRLFNGV
jgi:hypothetical protein